MSNRILLIFAHPAFHKSRINRVIVERLKNLPGLTFHDLYECYPDLDIDARAEQSLLSGHDIIVFQHPFFWYSTPAILKEWQDLVLEHGWAYGSTGNALRGKKWMHILTTGGRNEAYQHGAFNRFTIREFLRPLEQTAVLCKMEFIPPYLVHGTHLMTEDQASVHAERLSDLLGRMSSNALDWKTLNDMPSMNDALDNLLNAKAPA